MESSISKEEIGELPLCQFEGRITVVEDAEAVPALVEELLQYKVLGFDTETKPAFKKGSNHQVALMQLSTNNEAWLFRLNKIGFPPELGRLMASTSVKKVGVAIRDDVKGLNKLARFKPGGFVELQDMVKDFDIDVFSLKGLAGLLLNVRVSKRQRLSNWEADELGPGQIDYAAIDAWIGLRIFEELMLRKPSYQAKPIVFRN